MIISRTPVAPKHATSQSNPTHPIPSIPYPSQAQTPLHKSSIKHPIPRYAICATPDVPSQIRYATPGPSSCKANLVCKKANTHPTNNAIRYATYGYCAL
ncbi:hypothetical protein CC86DRAFT_168777 [Ophiobolus disseminans]|uniref:Uncharacterized protein n=1 Tax=Ophiobolus disseminans TaxID=1469910 RepID=A0A6A7AC62_9PLEO|nr:hypothetical protein CC86DRAFT_168777 [Ophiobolus disseminans]